MSSLPKPKQGENSKTLVLPEIPSHLLAHKPKKVTETAVIDEMVYDVNGAKCVTQCMPCRTTMQGDRYCPLCGKLAMVTSMLVAESEADYLFAGSTATVAQAKRMAKSAATKAALMDWTPYDE